MYIICGGLKMARFKIECKYLINFLCIKMEYIRTLNRLDGVDVGYHESPLEPLNGVGRVGKKGIDKNFKLEKLIQLAYEIKANIIVKAGPNAKWYLKTCEIKNLAKEIKKQEWRDTSRVKMWVIEWI